MHIFILCCSLILSLFAKTEYGIKDTWPYADDVLDPCFPDPCNSQGICSTSVDDEEMYSCSCINGFTGDTCTEELGACDMDYCKNGGTCYWAYEVQSCFCATGYTGDDCSEWSEELNDPCLNLVCGSDEQGYCVGNSENVGECVCYDGYSGDFCTIPIATCTASQFLDVVQQLLLIKPDYRDDCAYMTTQIWSMIPVDDEGPALCNCLTGMQQYIYTEMTNLDCAIEQGLTLTRAIEVYCPTSTSCTQESIDTMLVTVATLSDDCNHYVANFNTMPLYRQNTFKCSCLLGAANTYEEAVEVFSCPFTLTSAATGAVAWQNCYNDEVCNYEEIYSKFAGEMFEIDPVAAGVCLDFVELISLTELVTPENNELKDVMSPCLEAMHTKWPTGLQVLDCKPLAHYEVTIKEIMEKFVQQTEYANPSCTYAITSSVFDVAVGDFSGATMCLQAAVLGDQIATLNENFDELFCGCYDRLTQTESFDAAVVEKCALDVNWVVPSPQPYCEAYFGKTYSFVTDENNIPETTLSTSTTEEDVWTAVGIISTCLLFALIAINVWLLLTTKKSTSYADMKDNETGTAAATSG